MVMAVLVHAVSGAPAQSLVPLRQVASCAVTSAPATRTTTRPVSATRPADSARLGYRPDVDGLRALAVVLVVAFHAGVGWIPGGFVGVDVFFVISGFLITGLLVDELDRTGTVSLAGFYARRVRRLLPLSALVLVTTAVACAVILPPLAHQAVADDIRSAALWVSNWRFAAESTQYMADTQQSPVLHYWTLSLEEQFYVIWPLIILVVARTATRWGAPARRLLVAALGTVFVVSLLGSMVLTTSAGPWAYFGLHTRAWELAAGAALALGAHRLRSVPLPAAGLLGWAGVALILYSAFTMSRATPFPGVAAVVPVTGTVLVLAAGARTRGRGAAGLLGLPAIVYVGRISYGWYLWHWPLLVLAGVMASKAVDDAGSDGGTTTPLGYVLMAVLLSFALAAISHRFVEDPVRRSTWLAVRRHRSLALGAALTAVSVLGASLVLGSPDQHAVAAPSAGVGSAAQPASAATTSPAAARDSSKATGTPTPHATAAMTPAQARADAWPPTDCFAGFAQTNAPSGCRYGAPHGRTVVALIGDSHAAQWLPAMDRLAKQRGWQLWFWAKSACPMTDVSVWLPAYRTSYNACSTWRQAVLRRLSALSRLDLLVVTRSKGYQQGIVLDASGNIATSATLPNLWSDGTHRSVARMLGFAKRVVLVRDTPWPGRDVPDCLSAHLDDPESCAISRTRQAHGDQQLVDAEIAATSTMAAVRLVDPTDLVCPQESCPVVTADGVIKYRDKHHLTRTYSAGLWRAIGDLLAPSLTS